MGSLLKQRSGALRGFTLVELLVVVAIILILVAIALPNLQAALVRTKVSRSKAEIHTLQFACESYRVDYPVYPPARSSCAPEGISRFDYCRLPLELTTPHAYLEKLLVDPFTMVAGEPPCTYKYLAPGSGWLNGSPGVITLWVPVGFPQEPIAADGGPAIELEPYRSQQESPVSYALWSVGPASVDNDPGWVALEYQGVPVHRGRWYAPTNGTRSEGVITRLGSGQTSP